MLLIVFTTFLLASVHTLANPVHYLPFVALGRSRGWTLKKTVAVAAICGSGHLAAFALVVLAGFLMGRGFVLFEKFVNAGEDWGKILFLAFGFCYMFWGVKKALNADTCHAIRPDSSHLCESCGHGHESFLKKTDPQAPKYVILLFLMFVFGPCDAVLPIILYSSAEANWQTILLAGLAYYLPTIFIMGLLTACLYKGVGLLKFKGEILDKWAHAISGLVIIVASCFAFLS